MSGWSNEEAESMLEYVVNAIDISDEVIALIERKNEEIKRLKAKSDEMFEVLENILAIMNESRGVAGWHLNGNIASWDELELRDAVASAIEKACDPE